MVRGVVHKLYDGNDLMLHAPPRERVHVLTRSKGRLPQALTQALGPHTYTHTGIREVRGKGVDTRNRQESSLVSTGFN